MFIVLAVVLAIWRALAYDTAPVSDLEALGFSSSRLARIAAWQQAQVDAGAFSSAVAAIARNGKVAYLRAVGFRDHAKTAPLQPDAIFWIASMTKPVTSVAAMMLVDEGKLDLAAPVHQYLPEFRDMMVGVERTDPTSGETKLALGACPDYRSEWTSRRLVMDWLGQVTWFVTPQRCFRPWRRPTAVLRTESACVRA